MDPEHTEQDNPSSVPSPSATPKPRKRGRPRKSEVSEKKPGGRGKVGRPKGDAAILNEYRARMLASPKSEAVLAKVFEVALNDDHKHQAACMKLVMDRILPVSGFDKEAAGNKGTPQITVNIKGVEGVSFEDNSGDIIDHE